MDLPARPPNLKIYQIITLSRQHLIKQNYKTIIKVPGIVWLRQSSKNINQDKVLKIPHSNFHISLLWVRSGNNNKHARSTANTDAGDDAGQGNTGRCGNNACWRDTSFKRYDALKPCKKRLQCSVIRFQKSENSRCRIKTWSKTTQKLSGTKQY